MFELTDGAAEAPSRGISKLRRLGMAPRAGLVHAFGLEVLELTAQRVQPWRAGAEGP